MRSQKKAFCAVAYRCTVATLLSINEFCLLCLLFAFWGIKTRKKSCLSSPLMTGRIWQCMSLAIRNPVPNIVTVQLQQGNIFG